MQLIFEINFRQKFKKDESLMILNLIFQKL